MIAQAAHNNKKAKNTKKISKTKKIWTSKTQTKTKKKISKTHREENNTKYSMSNKLLNTFLGDANHRSNFTDFIMNKF